MTWCYSVTVALSLYVVILLKIESDFQESSAKKHAMNSKHYASVKRERV